MKSNQKFMEIALQQAQKGKGFTSPNPAVGAVIVKDNKIISSGYHRGPGTLHAEADALQKAGKSAIGAEMYVTLEPCNHFGRTPPCTQAIIHSGIKKVYYAVADPNPKVIGGGHAALEAAGIEVKSGLLKEDAEKVLRAYLHFTRINAPYVIAKFACSLDGKIATSNGESKWISSEVSRMEGHRLRQQVDAICVGAETVIKDDPQLTVRFQQKKVKHPLRVVLDSRARIPLTAKIFQPDLPGKTLVATTKQMPVFHKEQFSKLGVEVLTLAATECGRVDIKQLLGELAKKEITSLLVEGGPTVLASFFEARLVREIRAFLAPKIIGGVNAPGAVGGKGILNLHDVIQFKEMQFKQSGPDIAVCAYL